MKGTVFSEILLEWYYENGRDLPWRRDRDPYKIWISEIILQQTRVAQGMSYFLRFVGRFPDVETLAAADETEVLKYWEGLGYYSRARNLHRAARQIVSMGEFPHTYEAIRALKGVGDYTAAAIASFAFSLPYPVVDGNVYRVLSRYLGVDDPIDTTAGKKRFAQMARELFDTHHAADYNQAIMDFGALQCIPQNPRCVDCPLASNCVALCDGRVSVLPVKQGRTVVRSRFFTFIYIEVEGRIAFWQRPVGDIWTGLCQPLLLEWEETLPDEAALRRRVSGILGSCAGILSPLARPVRQRLSHQLLHASFFRLSLSERPLSELLPEGVFWVDCSQISRLAFPKMLAAIKL